MSTNINIFSPNFLKTFEECQQKFFYKYIEKINLPQPSDNFKKGKKIHALANYYLNGFDIKKMERALDSNEKNTWESLKNNKYFNLNVIQTEYNLSAKIDKYWIGGRLDALINNGTNFIILDYKTGEIPKNIEYDFQTIVYLLCTDRFLNLKNGYDSLKFVYLGLKNNTEKEVILNNKLKTDYEEKVVQICKNIDFAMKSNIYKKDIECKKPCEYCKICNNNSLDF